MAFSGSIKARERPCPKKSQGEKKGRTEAEQGGRRREKKKKQRGNRGNREKRPRKKKKKRKGRGESQISSAIVFVPAKK
jgi:hypothetical protein